MTLNVTLWILAGALVGWFACSIFHLNARRGIVVSALIGMGAAFFGGHLLSPAFGMAATNATAFDPLALLVAAVSSITCLTLADTVQERFDF